MTYLFDQCVREELLVLVKGLETLKDEDLLDELKEYKKLCLSTLKYQLKVRYGIE